MYPSMSRELVRIWCFTHTAALCKKLPSWTSHSEFWTSDWTPALHTAHSFCRSESFKAETANSNFHLIKVTSIICMIHTIYLPVRRLHVCSWAVNWNTVNNRSSAESNEKQSCTVEKKVKVTSQMKEISGRRFPSSDKLFVLDRVTWSFSNIFSMYTPPIRDSVQTQRDIELFVQNLTTPRRT